MACNSLKIYNNELFVDWKITCFWWQTCFYWVLEMIPLWLLPVFILILHPQCSLFRAEGGCPRNENGQQQNWRYAVYERKEKGLPKHKEIWKLMNIENMSWENYRPILPSFKYNFSDLILPTIRTVQLVMTSRLSWWIYFDMMNLNGWRVLYTAENLLYVTRLSLNFQKSILEKSTLSHKGHYIYWIIGSWS